MSIAAKLTRAAVFAGAAACATTSASKPPPPPPPPVEYPFALPPAPTEGKASLSGVVRENGHRAANMRVYVRNLDTNAHQEMVTNDKGEYHFADLEPGMWEVVPVPGYRGGRPQDGPVMQTGITAELAANANERRDLDVIPPPAYTPDTGPCCKPYGAPPARRRVV